MFMKTNIIQFPTGTWGFVGRVPVDLGYVQKNGEPLTDKQADILKHCGPGLIREQIKAVVFATKAEAENALKEFENGSA